jgi:DNA-binding NarL/FixJ family response regulator
VIVVDDHELARKGLVDLLAHRGICVVAEAQLAAVAISQAVEYAPDVLITELCMPGMSAIEATHRLNALAPEVRVLVLTGLDDDSYVMAALLAGACGYLLKSASIEQIVEGISAAAQGDSAISPAIATRLVRRLREPNRTSLHTCGVELTPREVEVLRLVARGSDNRRIAETLHLSEYTVKQYVSSILEKLQVGNRIQAAVRAVRCGLV